MTNFYRVLLELVKDSMVGAHYGLAGASEEGRDLQKRYGIERRYFYFTHYLTSQGAKAMYTCAEGVLQVTLSEGVAPISSPSGSFVDELYGGICLRPVSHTIPRRYVVILSFPRASYLAIFINMFRGPQQATQTSHPIINSR